MPPDSLLRDGVRNGAHMADDEGADWEGVGMSGLGEQSRKGRQQPLALLLVLGVGGMHAPHHLPHLRYCQLARCPQQRVVLFLCLCAG